MLSTLPGKSLQTLQLQHRVMHKRPRREPRSLNCEMSICSVGDRCHNLMNLTWFGQQKLIQAKRPVKAQTSYRTKS